MPKMLKRDYAYVFAAVLAAFLLSVALFGADQNVTWIESVWTQFIETKVE